MTGERKDILFTIGHSTRSLLEFLDLLKSFGVEVVVDVRSVPRSRHNSQFNKESFESVLKDEGFGYIHIPELGGFRRAKSDSVNLALQNKGFRGYADYMQTKEFSGHFLHLVSLIEQNRLSLMCAEALPWRCHRSLLSDALVARGFEVRHILGKDNFLVHELNPLAKVEGSKVYYPLFERVDSQRSLEDF